MGLETSGAGRRYPIATICPPDVPCKRCDPTVYAGCEHDPAAESADLAAAENDYWGEFFEGRPEDTFGVTAEWLTTDETRYVDPKTGGEKGQKRERLGGADPAAMSELAAVYGFGEEKYARYNYLKGYPWSLSIDALYRHFLAFQNGEVLDPESGLNHMAHVAWHALTLVSFSGRGLGTDDRPNL
jgi:hypothetical protein